MSLCRLAAIASAAFLLGATGCRGGSGELAMDDALDITAVEVSAPGGQVNLQGAEPGTGVVGQHALEGAGAQGRATVSLDDEGVLRIGTQCLPVAPCRLDLTLAVPPSLPVRVDLGAGDVAIEGIAEADVQVDRGSVRLDDAHSAFVRIGEGDLHAALTEDATLRAVLADGDAEVTVPKGGWQVTAESAQLKLSGVSLDRRATGVLDIHAPGGNVLLVGVEDLAAR